MSARKPIAAPFAVGDIVLDPGGDWPTTLGIVIESSARSATVVWANGGRSGGPGLLRCLVHREPRARADVTPALLGNRGWNREQAARATLRRIGIDASEEMRKPAGREAVKR